MRFFTVEFYETTGLKVLLTVNTVSIQISNHEKSNISTFW